MAYAAGSRTARPQAKTIAQQQAEAPTYSQRAIKYIEGCSTLDQVKAAVDKIDHDSMVNQDLVSMNEWGDIAAAVAKAKVRIEGNTVSEGTAQDPKPEVGKLQGGEEFTQKNPVVPAAQAANQSLPYTGEAMTPRDYQIEAYHAIAENIRHYPGPFFVEASVGAGKTMMMAMVAARAQEAGMNVWILARRGELVEQNAETLWECTVKNSIYSASVGRKSTHYKTIVGSEGTVARALESELLDQVPDIVLVDECHEVNFQDQDSQYMQIFAELMRRNHKLRIVGFTGSPYRGTLDILGGFWKKCVYTVRTPYLVDRGYLVPTIFGFGHDDVRYELEGFEAPDTDTHSDYTVAQLNAMQRQIMKDPTRTQKIMAEVMALTENRNAVMITGAGHKHLQEVATCLPDDSWVIITDKTGSKERRESLKAASRGEKKYILQIGCLTTGYDEPLIDTSVILRKIGSLTLLVQLLGRGMRLLKQKHKDAGYYKVDHLVLDYTDTMPEMADKYHNPILEKAQLFKAKQDHETIKCPECGTENSKFARRCVGENLLSPDKRCEWFWVSINCEECGVKNDSAARECRNCHATIKDPNEKLTGKHYTDDDWREVVSMTMRPTRPKKGAKHGSQGLVVEYLVVPDGRPQERARTKTVNGQELEVATEIFWPQAKEKWMLAEWKNKFLNLHLERSQHGKLKDKHPGQIAGMAELFDVPRYITHRVNDKGRSVIHRKRFRELPRDDE